MKPELRFPLRIFWVSKDKVLAAQAKSIESRSSNGNSKAEEIETG